MHSNLHGEAGAAASLDTAPSQAGRLAVLLGNALLRELRSSRLFYGAFAVWLSVTLAATFVIGDTLLPSISVYAKRINLVVALVVLAAVAAAVLATMRARSQAGLLQAFADHLVQTDLAGRTIRLLLAVGTFVLFMAPIRCRRPYSPALARCWQSVQLTAQGGSLQGWPGSRW